MLRIGKTYRYILSLEDVDNTLVSKVGGKNASLGQLIKGGFNVPPGFCVTSKAYALFIRENNLWPKIEGLLPSSPDEAEKASKAIRDLMESFDVPEEVDGEIKSTYRLMLDYLITKGIEEPKFSIRSSGTAEDLPSASFAGQFDTFLWKQGAESILEHVKKCWSSLFTARGIQYREEKKVSHKESLMSVGIQLMIDAKAAGVMFTIDPINGDRSLIQIEANWGLGESVVTGNTPVDDFKISKINFDIKSRSIQTKLLQCVPDPSIGDVVEKEVPDDFQGVPCLTDDEIIELAKQARAIEKYYGHPQDIEFAIEKKLEFPKNIFILQSRPETNWSRKKEPLSKPKGHIADHLVSWLVGEGGHTASLEGKKILVVDDEPDVLDTIAEELDMCIVHRAEEYDSGLQCLLNENYDIVILDIMGVNGLELLRTSVERGFPTVMFTAHALTVESLEESKKRGAVSFLPKESLPDLKEFLEEVVRESGKPIWSKTLTKVGYFFDKRFGEDWRKKVGF